MICIAQHASLAYLTLVNAGTWPLIYGRKRECINGMCNGRISPSTLIVMCIVWCSAIGRGRGHCFSEIMHSLEYLGSVDQGNLITPLCLGRHHERPTQLDIYVSYVLARAPWPTIHVLGQIDIWWIDHNRAQLASWLTLLSEVWLFLDS